MSAHVRCAGEVGGLGVYGAVLCSYLMDLYFSGNTFYDIKNHDSRIADPEDRITEQAPAPRA
jgi:hypothetical protein